MRNVYYIIIALFLFLIMIVPQIVFAEENNWGLKIKLDKQEYLLYEKIWMDVTLTNKTSDSIRTKGISTPNQRGFNVVLKNSSGKKLEYTGPISVFGSSFGHLIMAGDYEYQSFDLLQLFEESKTERKYYAPWGYFNYLPVGSYSVQVNFDGAISNIVYFKIIVPSSSELDALKLLGEANKIPMGRKTMYLAATIFQKLVDEYPNSVYAETCFRFSRKNSKEEREAIDNGIFDHRGLTLEILDKFPNSGKSRTRLRWLSKKLNKKEFNKILNKFIDNYPNKRVAKFAKQKLKQIKQEELHKQKNKEE